MAEDVRAEVLPSHKKTQVEEFQAGRTKVYPTVPVCIDQDTTHNPY